VIVGALETVNVGTRDVESVSQRVRELDEVQVTDAAAEMVGK
jgi:hypothetical protein